MKKLAEKIVHVAFVLPVDLHERLMRQVAKETADRLRRVTPSQIIRWAVEDYLDAWGNATFVPDKKGE